MPTITRATAYSNNEVGYLAWTLDGHLPDCLGFHIVREYLDAAGAVVDERPLASYVAFKGQRNRKWLAQNPTVWPVQKFSWRDLTPRKRRDQATRRPPNRPVPHQAPAVGAHRGALQHGLLGPGGP